MRCGYGRPYRPPGTRGSLAHGTPLPYYMAVERTLTRDVSAGSMITRDMVEAPRDSALWSLREAQDARGMHS